MSVNYKSLSKEELEKWFEGLVEFKTPPLRHQLACMAFALGENITKVMFGNGIGTGKTLLALYLMQCWNPKGRVLVVCPNSVISGWEEQIEEHTDFSKIVIRGTKEERFKALYRKKDIYLINYEGLRVLFSKEKQYKYRGKVKKKKVPDIEMIRKFGFEMVIFDECHHVKDWSAQQSKVAHAISKYSRYAIAMSGTLLGKDASDLFSEYYVLNDGVSLGDNYTDFLESYFWKPAFKWELKRVCGVCGELYGKKSEHLNNHRMTIQQYRKKFPKEKTAENLILERIAPSTISFSKEECTNLPEKVYQIRNVEPTAEMIQVMNELMDGIRISKLTKMNIENHTQKLVQVTGGFLLNEGALDAVFSPNPKVNELRTILSEINEKTIIYHYYQYESKLISDMMNALGYEYVVINGTVPEKKRGIAISEFKNNEKCQFCIAHPKTGGEGLNLQHASNIIYYSNSFIGNIAREQSEGRIHRQGQIRNCLYIDLVMSETIDEVLYNSLMERGNSFRSILNYIQSFHEKPRKPLASRK